MVSRPKNACRSLFCSPAQVLLLREELEKARMVAAKAQIPMLPMKHCCVHMSLSEHGRWSTTYIGKMMINNQTLG